MEHNITILIVDDDPSVRFSTARILSKAGYDVRDAPTASNCLKQMKEVLPDLILMDVVMPKMSGIELCRLIKADPHYSSVYIILVSNTKTDTTDQALGLELGADGYIARPISNRELLARVDSMVRILTAERERDRVISELKQAMAEIKVLSGLLPICSYCKKIRDDKGYWNRIDEYISQHTSTRFSHGICGDCAKEQFPDLNLPDSGECY